MQPEDIWMIGGALGILVLGALYGYWIGTIAKRRAWGVRRVMSVSYAPILILGGLLMIGAVYVRHHSGGSDAPVWTKFPWIIMVVAGFLSLAVAKRVAFPGVSLKELDNDKLPIR